MEELQTAKTSENEGSIADTTKEVSEVEFEDGASSEAEVKEDSKSTSVYDGKTEKKPQSKELNSEYARKRREQQQAEKDTQLRIKTIIETLDGINPFTQREMKDARDVEEYLLMKEIDKNGGDPQKDYSEYLKTKDRKKEKELEEAARQKQWLYDDMEDFQAKHPDLNFEEVISDRRLNDYAKGRVGVDPLDKIYTDFLKNEKEHQEEINRKAAQMLANQNSSVGSLSGTGTAEEVFFSHETASKMTHDQIHKNYDAIRKSMSKW